MIPYEKMSKAEKRKFNARKRKAFPMGACATRTEIPKTVYNRAREKRTQPCNR